jgi:hypothetical protein
VNRLYLRAEQNFSISQRPSNIPILRNILELKQWTNGNQGPASEPIGNNEGSNMYVFNFIAW